VIRVTPHGIVLSVRVIPRARKTDVAGVRNDALVVRVAAPPVDDAANEALVEFVASRLRVARRAVRLVAGARGRDKRLAVEGITEAEALARLG